MQKWKEENRTSVKLSTTMGISFKLAGTTVLINADQHQKITFFLFLFWVCKTEMLFLSGILTSASLKHRDDRIANWDLQKKKSASTCTRHNQSSPHPPPHPPDERLPGEGPESCGLAVQHPPVRPRGEGAQPAAPEVLPALRVVDHRAELAQRARTTHLVKEKRLVRPKSGH